MPRKTETPYATRIMQKYNALSPMMKIIFSSEAQLRFADDKDLMPMMDDLVQADKLAHTLLRYPFATAAQAGTVIERTVAPLNRKDTVLNYAANALMIGDAIMFRAAYAYGKAYGSMQDFSGVHPMMVDAPTLQRQIAFLKRMNKTDFNMSNPVYSKYYKKWVSSSPQAAAFDKRRENYTLAMTSAMKALGITFKRTTLPYTGVGREFIKEVVRERC